jgi:hypothetical protein
MVFTKIPWLIVSDEQYSRVKEAWKVVIEAQDRRQKLAGAPVGTLSA